MRWRSLDDKIARFSREVTSAIASAELGGRPDWNALWGLESEIQNEFDSGVRYPTKHDHDQAWQQFSEARDRLGESRRRSRDSSVQLRDKILARVQRSRPTLPFVFDHQEAEAMRALGRALNAAAQTLGREKEDMLVDDERACSVAIEEVRAIHDAWWLEYQDPQLRGRYERLIRSQESLAGSRDPQQEQTGSPSPSIAVTVGVGAALSASLFMFVAAVFGVATAVWVVGLAILIGLVIYVVSQVAHL